MNDDIKYIVYDEGLKIDIAKAMNKGTLGIQDDIEE